ncbi:class F sortase [Streptomyces sp. B3I8]|uniref:class F sortase n=1 Tax=Streptomyces sp. B3I8 TaxID=3042303 RepID=UPI0027899AEC|nr:class F sortase [Streptomyces sp. B3I8]MDQ0788181.1 LPXTG-site transpeptidase (sortase) family protein [Streptomyces sp. B3I8]
MTALSRRAFATAALALLLTACGGGGEGVRSEGSPGTVQGADAGGESSAGRDDTSAGPTNAARPLARSAPARLRIPRIGVDTPVIRLGLAADGTVEVPPVTAHDRAGWYDKSPTPGRTGPSVLLGHVTVGQYGDGVFRRLSELHRGDHVTTRLRNGTTAAFTVTRVRTVDKAHFPTQEVYGDVDRPELRLITCGGPRSGDGYRDNVIVFAALDGG